MSAELLVAVVLSAVTKIIGLVVVGGTHRRKFQKIGTVANLYLYPVRSCGVMEKTEADCTPVGLFADGLTDRHWMVTDDRDKHIDMRTAPSLTLVKCQALGDIIRLTAPGMANLDLPRKPHLQVSQRHVQKVENQDILVVDCGKEAERWISDYLKRPAKIVFSCSDLGTRDVSEYTRKWENTARKGDVTVFAYLTSYLMATTASLRHINSKLSSPVSMVNFRPNIVIENDVPFDEDTWTEIMIGDNVLFHFVEPCLRCLITTVDPNTGVRDEKTQPLELLRSFRCQAPYGKSPRFGVYFSNDVPGHVKVGDPVYVLKNETCQT